jgi:hypothetical protein
MDGRSGSPSQGGAVFETVTQKDVANAIYGLGIEGVSRAESLRLVDDIF